MTFTAVRNIFGKVYDSCMRQMHTDESVLISLWV